MKEQWMIKQPSVWDSYYVQQNSIGLNSRSEVKLGNKLPLMVAPMDTVLDNENYKTFLDAGIIPIMPRGTSVKHMDLNKVFLSVSLDEFVNLYCQTQYEITSSAPQVCIDVANGNMPKLHKAIKQAKEIHGEELVIMAGNISSLKAFEVLSRAGADYIRVGVGTGTSCNTTHHTGVGCNLPDLLKQLFRFRNIGNLPTKTKIIADGGFKKYSDVIKALYWGADYVMSGSIFAQCLESCGDKYVGSVGRASNTNFIEDEYKDFFSNNTMELISSGKLYTHYRGMSTREVQTSWGKKIIKHSEGKHLKLPVRYTLSEWVDGSERDPDNLPGFVNCLRSAMSYTGATNLEEFKFI